MEFSKQIEKKETRTTNLNANLSQTSSSFLEEGGRVAAINSLLQKVLCFIADLDF
jgi:hypothetical protein